MSPQKTITRLREALQGLEPKIIDADFAPRRAAIAGLIARRPAPSLLLIKRAEHPQDPWSGHMSFPGGRVEANEGDLEAAHRETHEELGIQLTEAQLLGRLDDLQAVGRGRVVPMAIAPFFFIADERPCTIPDPREVAEALWVPLEYLLAEENISTMDYQYQGETRELPCYDYEGRRIWGLTYMMIRRLLDLAQA